MNFFRIHRIFRKFGWGVWTVDLHKFVKMARNFSDIRGGGCSDLYYININNIIFGLSIQSLSNEICELA